jgi:hypothetical protein
MTYRTVLKIDDLNPDGVKVCVNWAKMGVNMSVFIPCINTEEAIRQVQRVFKDKGWQSESRITIESGKLGVRVWRTL